MRLLVGLDVTLTGHFHRGEAALQFAQHVLQFTELARAKAVGHLGVDRFRRRRDRLVQLIDEASGNAREIEILPPLGHDFGLPALVVDHIRRVALESGVTPMCWTAVLLGHGSRRNPAFRPAATWLGA